MSDNAMIPHDGNGSALSAYQDRDDVRELGDRLMAMHPAAGEVGPAAMRAAAQLALMLGANPLPGVNEVHIWKQSGKTCMSLGINYWRRKGQEWGGYLFEVRPRQMNPKERADYGVPDGTIAAVCRGVRAADMIKWRGLGFTVNEIWDMCGATGVGTQGANEYAKNGRPNIWTSLKRAETDMLRQLFPAEFAQVDRQAMSGDMPLITIDQSDGDQDDATDGITQGGEEVEEGRYTLDDFNADMGLGQPSTPAAQPAPAPGPMPDDELTISEATAAAFVNLAAGLLDTDADDLKARLKALGYTGVPGKPADRLAAYRAVKAARPVEAAAHDEPLFPPPVVDPA